MDKAKGNSKLLWDTLNSIINFKNAKHSSLDQIEYGNGTIENDPKNISEAVNNHFVTLVDQLFKNKVNVIDPDSRTDNELEKKITIPKTDQH